MSWLVRKWREMTQRDFDGIRVVGWGPFALPGEKKRRERSMRYAERITKMRREARTREETDPQ